MRQPLSADAAQDLADQLGVRLQSLDPPTLARRISDMLAFVEELDEAVAGHPDAMVIVSLENERSQGWKVANDGPA